VVVGSRIIEEIEQSTPDNVRSRVHALVAGLRQGIDEVKS
jgi:tryptophan synthase alpha chain